MADEPVSAWREPLSRRARRWARRNRTAVTAAAAALLAGVVGLSAVLAVQTRAKADIAQALRRETSANAALAAANAELSRSKAAVQARYDLAVEAIKTFHTGVSEDFLLKQDQFKELRDRLLKSAARLLRQARGAAGRGDGPRLAAGTAQANFEVAELTGRVGRKEDCAGDAPQGPGRPRGPGAATRADEADSSRRGRAAGRCRAAATTPSPTSTETWAKPAEALAAQEAKLAICRRLAEAQPDRPGRRRDVAATLGNIGHLKSGRRQDSPRPCLTAGVAGRLRRTGQGPSRRYRASRGIWRSAISSSARCLHNGQAGRSVGGSRGGTRRLREADGDPPGGHDRSVQPGADATKSIAGLLQETGKLATAETALEAARAIYQKLADAYPADSDVQSCLARTYNQIGALLVNTGRLSEAPSAFETGLAIHRKLAEANPTIPDYRSQMADSHLIARLGVGQARPHARGAGFPRQERRTLRRAGRRGAGLRGAPEHAGPGPHPVRQPLADRRPADRGSRETPAGRGDPGRAGPGTARLGLHRSALANCLRGVGRAEAAAGRPAEALRGVRAGQRDRPVPGRHVPGQPLQPGVQPRPHGPGLGTGSRDELARRAVEALRRALADGYSTFELVRGDHDLDALRDRRDFRDYLLDLAFPAEPFAP